MRLVHSNDVLFIATGISDSPLLRGVQLSGQSVVTHSVLMRQHSGSVRFVTTEHDLTRRPVRLRSVGLPSDDAALRHASSFDGSHERSNKPHYVSHSTLTPTTDISCLLLFGAPGSGKGTIGTALSALPGFTHCSSGDIIRAVVSRNSGTPDRWKEVTSGQLLSDHMLWELFDEYLNNYLQRRSQRLGAELLLLDGIPRSASQVKELANRVTVRGVLHFDCGDQDALMHRISRRFLQGGRSDDASLEVVRTRLQVYYEQTLPSLDLYPADSVHRIDSTQQPEIVLREVLKQLDKVRMSPRIG